MKKKQHPEVKIVVYRGVVESVFASDPDLEVEILDKDTDEGDELARIERKEQRLLSQLHQNV